MEPRTAISVQDLGKRYSIGPTSTAWMRLKSAFAIGRENLDRDFWALRNVTFEVERGERLGIVGRNGAGKSTLLKLLSKITMPSEGRAVLSGRVSSLLEVGVGFNPELTGRENIFMNGAVMGLRRTEIAARFDEIVAFAGTGSFLDTPVKRYSTGMRVRLGFAVAAHLEPEILIVDEVLAVGDAEFRQRSLGKIQGVGRNGKTILFVSHNMQAVQSLCTRVIWLDKGGVRADGPAAEVVESYLAEILASQQRKSEDVRDLPRRPGHGERARITQCKAVESSLHIGEPFSIDVDAEALAPGPYADLNLVLGLNSLDGTRVASCSSGEAGVELDFGESRRLACRATFSDVVLNPGRYSVTLVLRSGIEVIDRLPECLYLDVLDVPHGDLDVRTALAGFFRLRPHWTRRGE
ncbi:MAG: ABC transporter ATP-binding protein [Myxococcota bacterium]